MGTATPSGLLSANRHNPLAGIFWMVLASALLSGMDAIAKWMVAALPVLQILSIRSLLVLVLLSPLVHRQGGLATFQTTRPGLHLLRAGIIVATIICFFESLRFLPLATVIAIGFAAPLFMTALSVVVLGERVGLHRWSAVAVGFVGVLLIVQPGGAAMVSLPALLALAAALLFAVSLVTLRLLARTESDSTLMVYPNLGIFLAGTVGLPFVWQPPTAIDLGLILAMAATLVLGQFAQLRAFRAAPVAVVAPFQYTELIWATLLGWAIWAEFPAAHVWAGAAVVIASGLYILWREVRAKRAESSAPPG